jgi:uncharacterized protein YqgC (DUF456 family)
MTELLGIVLLALCSVAGLLMILLGLPGLWVMGLGVLAYGWLTAFRSVGVGTIAVVLGLAFLGEIIETWAGFRLAQRYGGSRRAAWGALLGGLAGAVMGVPVPLVGSVVGAFVGSFAGAVLFEFLATQRADVALTAGKGAVLGRAVAVAAKVGIGVVIAVVSVAAVLRA